MNKAPTLTGDRVVLRSVHESDKNIFESNREPDFLLMVGSPDKNTDYDKNDSFENALHNPFQWAITVNKHCIGTTFLHSFEKRGKRARYAVGIFEPHNWNKGLGTEITRLVLDYAFNRLCLHRVDLRVLEYNKRAINCYKKCGFKHEGIERHSAFIDGKWYDDIIMGILDFEYKSLSKPG